MGEQFQKYHEFQGHKRRHISFTAAIVGKVLGLSVYGDILHASFLCIKPNIRKFFLRQLSDKGKKTTNINQLPSVNKKTFETWLINTTGSQIKLQRMAKAQKNNGHLGITANFHDTQNKLTNQLPK